MTCHLQSRRSAHSALPNTGGLSEGTAFGMLSLSAREGEPNHTIAMITPGENHPWVIQALGSNSHVLILTNRNGASPQKLCSEWRSVFQHILKLNQHTSAGSSGSHEARFAVLVTFSLPSIPSGAERPTELLLQSEYRASERPVIKKESVLISLQFLCITGLILCGMSEVLEENC